MSSAKKSLSSGKEKGHGDVFVLYTIAKTRNWAIPGAEIIESSILEKCDKEKRPENLGMISLEDYRGQGKQVDSFGIHKEDISLLENRLQTILTA